MTNRLPNFFKISPNIARMLGVIGFERENGDAMI
jgi:hypothetical protein